MQGAPLSESRCQNSDALLFAGTELRSTQQVLSHDEHETRQLMCWPALELPPFASANSKGKKIGMIVCPQHRTKKDDRLSFVKTQHWWNAARPFSKDQDVLIRIKRCGHCLDHKTAGSTFTGRKDTWGRRFHYNYWHTRTNCIA